MSKKKDADAINASDEIITSLVKTLNAKGKTAYTFFDRDDPSEIKYWISTGSTLLDYAISNRRNGGIPFGRITEINGLESTGKSLLSLHMAANTQKMGGIAVILDTEDRMLNKDFCERMGIDLRKIVWTNPGSIEGCFEHIEKSICDIRKNCSSQNVPVIIVWDSLAASSPQAEIEGTYDPQSQMGLGAKAVARGLRKLTHVIGTESIALVMINQLRMNLRAMPFCDPYITPYGKSLAYYASVRLRIAQTTKLKSSDGEVIGVTGTVKTVKNSLGPPMRTVEFPIIYGYGVDDQQSWYDYLWKKEVIKKSAGVSKINLCEKQHEFKHNEWKHFLAQQQNKNDVLDLLEHLMVKKYEDTNPILDLDITTDTADKDTEN